MGGALRHIFCLLRRCQQSGLVPQAGLKESFLEKLALHGQGQRTVRAMEGAHLGAHLNPASASARGTAFL